MKLNLQSRAWIVAIVAVLVLTACSKKTEDAGTMPKLRPWTPMTVPRATSTEEKPAPVQWRKVEESVFEWNGRGKVKLIAEIPDPYGDSGNFTRIRITVPGEKEFVLENPDGWLNWDDKESSLREVPLTKALAAPRSHAFLFVSNGRRDVLLLSSWEYASNPSRLHVIELPNAGLPVVVFNDLLDINAIEDLDGDGVKEIAGAPCLSQTFGPNAALSTYDPLHVLHFDETAGGKLKLSIPLSRAYNEKHYYGWAGPDCSEQLAVYTPKQGKPKILPAEEAEKLAEADQEK